MIKDFDALLEFLCSRRSVRRFQPQPVEQAVIESLLETAAWAPSAHNRQPWRFAVLSTGESKQNLAYAMSVPFQHDLEQDGLPVEEIERRIARSQLRILEAPVIILVCYDGSEMDVYPDPRRSQAEYLMGVQSVAMAGENLMLAASARGLGSVWVCAPLFVPEIVRQALDLPGSWEPQGMIFLGYPAKPGKPRERKSLSDIVLSR